MKTRTFIISLLILTGFNFCYSQNRQYGRYKNLKRYWGDEFTLNKDSTFIYYCNNKTPGNIEFTDSSFGRYKLVGDTIFLNYLFNNYHPFLSDSPKDSLKWEIIEPHGYFGNRPQKLYWRRKRLYYIIEETGEIFWNKEHHLNRITKQ